jgi:hypothetical protein
MKVARVIPKLGSLPKLTAFQRLDCREVIPRLASPSLNRTPAGVCYPHVGNCTRPVICPHNLSRHRREPGAHEAGQQFDIKSVGQHQRFGAATRPGAVEHFEQAALIFAKVVKGQFSGYDGDHLVKSDDVRSYLSLAALSIVAMPAEKSSLKSVHLLDSVLKTAAHLPAGR